MKRDCEEFAEFLVEFYQLHCERLREFRSQCCSESHYVATLVLEDLMRKANELRHELINLRDAMKLEHDEREVQPVSEELRDVQEEAAE